MNPCVLCGESAPIFCERDRRTYHRCGSCDLVFVPARFHPSPEEELARYRLHRNSDGDPRYHAFLTPFQRSLAALLRPGDEGLDFGCGPAPVLAGIFQRQGYSMDVYDPFFFPNQKAFDRAYDFISCTETAEHFHDPRREFDLVDRLLRPGAWLGVMTQMLDDWSTFPGWYYPRDPTHVCFYSQKTMRWLGERLGWEVRFPMKNVVVFRKG